MNKSFYDYNKTEEIKKGLYLIQDFQGNYGLISSAGEIIVPTNYETYVIAEKNKILFNKGAIKFTPGIAACAEIILDLESIKQTPKNTFIPNLENNPLMPLSLKSPVKNFALKAFPLS